MLTDLPDDFTVDVKGDRNLRVIPYFGGKARFRHVFDAILPDEAERVVDVFGGSAAFSIYACRRYGGHKVVYNDLSHHLVNLMRHVRDCPRDLHDAALTHYKKHSREYYLKQREVNFWEGVEGAGNLFYLAHNAFSSLVRIRERRMEGTASSHFITSFGHAKNRRPNLETLLSISQLMQGMEILNLSYHKFASETGSLIYLDPPYFVTRDDYYYGGLLDEAEFKSFLRDVGDRNKVVLSEQNGVDFFGIEDWRWRPVRMKRAPAYAKDGSKGEGAPEMIAWNF